MVQKELKHVCANCFITSSKTGNQRLVTSEEKASRPGSSVAICKVCGKGWELLRVVKGPWNQWKLAQQRPEEPIYLLCKHANCPNGECKMAHNPDELDVWKQERDAECGFDERRPRAFPESLMMTAPLEEVKVQSCSAYLDYGRCPRSHACTSAHTSSELVTWRQELERRKTAVANAAPPPLMSIVPRGAGGPNARMPVRIRPRPAMPWIRHFNICISVRNRVTCTHGKMCTYAHSLEEQAEWNNPMSTNVRPSPRGPAIPGRAVTSGNEAGGAHRFVAEVRRQVANMSPADLLGPRDGISIVEQNASPHTLRVSRLAPLSWKFIVQCTRNSHFLLESVVLADPGVKEVSISSGAKYINGKLDHVLNAIPGGHGLHIDERISTTQAIHIKITYTPVKTCVRQIVVFKFPRFKMGLSIVVDYVSPDAAETESSLLTVHHKLSSQERAKAALINSRSLFWEEEFEVVPYPKDNVANKALPKYMLPVEIEDQVKKGAYDNLETGLTEQNYRSCLHILLYIEEVELRNNFQRFDVYEANLKFEVEITLADGAGMLGVGVAPFRLCYLPMAMDIDDHEQSLNTWCMALLRPATTSGLSPRVYEAAVERVGHHYVVLKVPLRVAEECKGCKVDIRFSLYRDDLRRYHFAVDQVSLPVVFPAMEVAESGLKTAAPPILDKKNLDNEITHNVLNESQRAVLDSMLKLDNRQVPTILSGPFGTGKTRSLVEAILLLLRFLPAAKVLVCTSVNPTADHYVRDLHLKWTEQGGKHLSMFRFLSPSRRVNTVDAAIHKYSRIEGNAFAYPSLDELLSYQCVVTSISNADELVHMNVPKTHFTHIVVDETAQMIEPACLIPLSLASIGCKVVLAGDTMQVEPVVQSTLVRRYGLHRSLLERLYYTPVYKAVPMLRIDLLLNYRCVREILELASDLFYQSKVLHRHTRKPGGPVDRAALSFFNVNGMENRHEDSPSFFNLNESAVVVEQVQKFVDGGLGQKEIGVVAPYAKQVEIVRSELRKRRLSKVTVMPMRALQGHEFRVVIATTVRTCGNERDRNPDDPTLGFLSGPKLFNTLITRAEQWLVVVGNALTLCSVGNNRGNWYAYLQRCNRLASYFSDGDEGNSLEALWEKASSMRDLVVNATESAFQSQEIPKAHTLEQNQQSILQFKQCDPDARQSVFWNRLHKVVEERYPMNYHQILGVLTRESVEEVFDMMLDEMYLKQRAEEVVKQYNINTHPADNVVDVASDYSSMQYAPGASVDPTADGGGDQVVDSYMADSFDSSNAHLGSRLSASVPEFIPSGRHQLYQQQQQQQQQPQKDELPSTSTAQEFSSGYPPAQMHVNGATPTSAAPHYTAAGSGTGTAEDSNTDQTMSSQSRQQSTAAPGVPSTSEEAMERRNGRAITDAVQDLLEKEAAIVSQLERGVQEFVETIERGMEWVLRTDTSDRLSASQETRQILKSMQEAAQKQCQYVHDRQQASSTQARIHADLCKALNNFPVALALENGRADAQAPQQPRSTAVVGVGDTSFLTPSTLAVPPPGVTRESPLPPSSWPQPTSRQVTYRPEPPSSSTQHKLPSQPAAHPPPQWQSQQPVTNWTSGNVWKPQPSVLPHPTSNFAGSGVQPQQASPPVLHRQNSNPPLVSSGPIFPTPPLRQTGGLLGPMPPVQRPMPISPFAPSVGFGWGAGAAAAAGPAGTPQYPPVASAGRGGLTPLGPRQNQSGPPYSFGRF